MYTFANIVTVKIIIIKVQYTDNKIVTILLNFIIH